MNGQKTSVGFNVRMARVLHTSRQQNAAVVRTTARRYVSDQRITNLPVLYSRRFIIVKKNGTYPVELHLYSNGSTTTSSILTCVSDEWKSCFIIASVTKQLSATSSSTGTSSKQSKNTHRAINEDFASNTYISSRRRKQ